MINCLRIEFDREIPIISNSIADNIIVVEEARDNIIKFSTNEPEAIYKIINNQEHSLPQIIYSKPYKNVFKIYGIGDNGANGINAIFKNVIMNRTFKIKNEIYEIKGIPTIESNIDVLPYNNGRINTYTTLAPINIFNTHNHKVFKSILYKHFENGEFDNKNIEKVNSFYDDIKIYANEQIRDSIAYTISNLLKKDKAAFEFISKINIEWENIKIVHEKYHSQERSMPMIKGKFRSNFVLPKFVGYKIGKGFGELSLKDSYKI